MVRKFMSMAIAILLLSGSAHALDPIPQESGFSGFLRAGVGILNYKSNMVAGNNLMDVGNDRINSLTDEPDRESTGMGMFNFELAYTISTTRTQFTLGSQLEDIAQLQLGQQLAIKQELPDKSVLMAGFLFSGIPTEVWEDPYVTGRSRKGTDRDSTGGRLVYDRILGSNFELRYSYRNVEVDNERSGRALGLSAAQRDLLRRDGTDHWLDLNYRFTFQRRHVLIPSIIYFANDRDGDAMTNDGVDLQLTYIFTNDPFSVVLNGRVGQAEYDEANPIFGKTQEDDRFGADIQVYFKNPFGWQPFGLENFSVFAMGSYWLSDANIDFYDTEVTIGLAGVMVRF